jgi:carbamate kinase
MVETAMSPVKRASDEAEALAAKRQRTGANLLLHSDSEATSSGDESATPKTAEKTTLTFKSHFAHEAGSRRKGQGAEHKPLRLVVAVGGNALQRRGEKLSMENQLKAAMEAAPTLKMLAQQHQVVLTHGNGPQVGALALERKTATFDCLGAESQGQIGLIFSQALGTVGMPAAPIVTQVRVDPADPAFQNPTKYVGPVYTKDEAEALADKNGWIVKADGQHFRRVVPSPPPLQIMQLDAVRALLDAPCGQPPMSLLPIACGGGGAPVRFDEAGTVKGVEAVIDKDNCGALLANEIDADVFIILTDGGGIWENFGKPNAREMCEVTPEYLLSTKAGKDFPGSMGPKIQAAINFVQRSTRSEVYAAIGDLRDTEHILSNAAGTFIKKNVEGGVRWRNPADAVGTSAAKGKA